MKKTAALTAALWICVCLLLFSSTTALAQETESYTEGVGISVEVPGSHLLTIIVTGNADVTLDGQEGTVFTVARLSEPVLEIRAKNGKKMTKVTLNGEEITDKLVDGHYTLAPVYEDRTLHIIVETAEETTVEPTAAPTTAPSTQPATSPAQPSGSLPQTGQVILPIFLLLILAAILIVLGMKLMTSKKER